MRTTCSVRRLGAAALLLLAGLGGATAPAATLRWKFQPGETLHYVMDQKVVTSFKGGPRDVSTTTTQKIDMDWNVKEVSPDGVASLTQTITRVRTKMESPFGTIEYDSQGGKDPEGPIAAGMLPLLKALVGAQFSFKMNSQGELSDVKVPEGLIKALTAAGPGGGSGKGMFSEEGMKNMVTESSLALPREDLTRGKSWTRKTRIPMPPIGAMTYDKTYSYEGSDPSAGKGVDRIKLETKVAIDREGVGGDVEVSIKSQEGSGRFDFDSSAGRVAESKVSEKIEMAVKVKDQSFTQGTETTTNMTLVKTDAAR